jgi:hypothetical protein
MDAASAGDGEAAKGISAAASTAAGKPTWLALCSDAFSQD